MNLGNIHDDPDRMLVAKYALGTAAFNIETVAHMCGMEEALLPLSEELRKVQAAMNMRLHELGKPDLREYGYAPGNFAKICSICNFGFKGSEDSKACRLCAEVRANQTSAAVRISRPPFSEDTP